MYQSCYTIKGGLTLTFADKKTFNLRLQVKLLLTPLAGNIYL